MANAALKKVRYCSRLSGRTHTQLGTLGVAYIVQRGLQHPVAGIKEAPTPFSRDLKTCDRQYRSGPYHVAVPVCGDVYDQAGIAAGASKPTERRKPSKKTRS